jgi:hypothetical protein
VPHWVLSCESCQFELEHSEISNLEVESYFLPIKPEISPNSSWTCPRCGNKSIYQRTDLLYRA